MAIFGLFGKKKAPTPVPTGRGWWSVIKEADTGNWQRNVEVDEGSVKAFHAVFSCMTLIASDVSKLRLKLMEKSEAGIWEETTRAAFTPVLRKPNKFQNRIQFWENYILSKLSTGNVYVLKRRDARQVVTALYVLDPHKVTPLVTDSGEVYYEVKADNISGVLEDLVIPAREIIHDRFNTIYHPLVGTSPIHAAGVAAMQALGIQNNSTRFFRNGARPSGVLTAPGAISDDTADRLKEYWGANFTGENAGKVAVVGDGLKYEPMAMTANDSQVIEQLRWTAEVVCSTFHVPPYKVGVGDLPSYNNVQSLNVEYYSQCLQKLLEDAELCLNEGLGLEDEKLGTEFDLDGLLRMDTVTQIEVLSKTKNLMTLDERRKRLHLGPIAGGDTVYMQVQDHSIEAIAARDKRLIERAETSPLDGASLDGTPPQAAADPDGAEGQAQTERALLMLDAKMTRAIYAGR